MYRIGHRYSGADVDIPWSVVGEDLPILNDRVGAVARGGTGWGRLALGGWVVRHGPVGTPDGFGTDGTDEGV